MSNNIPVKNTLVSVTGSIRGIQPNCQPTASASQHSNFWLNFPSNSIAQNAKSRQSTSNLTCISEPEFLYFDQKRTTEQSFSSYIKQRTTSKDNYQLNTIYKFSCAEASHASIAHLERSVDFSIYRTNYFHRLIEPPSYSHGYNIQKGCEKPNYLQRFKCTHF